MSVTMRLNDADLAALLCSKVCHDLISPVGAINNGMELYDEGGAEQDALNLIRMSAANASARLQFARIAYGAAGAATSEIDTGDAESVAKQYMANEKANLIWNGPRVFLPKNEVKLLLNLLLVANASIPRGGDIHMTLHADADKRQFVFDVRGKMLRVPPKFLEFNTGKSLSEPVDAHVIQPYYTVLLSHLSHMPIAVTVHDENIILQAG